MKKILITSIALLFGCAVFAQSAGEHPQFPYASYKCELMNPDAYPQFPYASYYWEEMNSDAFPPSVYSTSKEINTTPPAQGPNSPTTKYKAEMMKPDYPSYPPSASPYKKKMLPY